MTPPDLKILTREIMLGFWKVHILHHASEHPVVGQWVLTELRRHGYDISPGTLYPLLQRMERNGWLRSETEPGGGRRSRRYYHLTPAGTAVLGLLRAAVAELHHEVIEERHSAVRTAPRHGAGVAGRRTHTQAAVRRPSSRRPSRIKR